MTFDGEDDGKYVYKQSFSSGVGSFFKKIPMPMDAALVALFSLGVIAVIVRRR